DQGEELFQSEGSEETAIFLQWLRHLTSQPTLALIVLFTIRSNAYESLQTCWALSGLTQQTFSLAPMPQGAYKDIIEGPPARLKNTSRPLKIEPALTQTILEDLEKGRNKDALPLLAFTLQRLYQEYGGDGRLSAADYHAMGGLEGAIEAAVEQALVSAERDPDLADDRATLTKQLRQGFIPWLAGIDPDSKRARRRVANLTEIPEQARPILKHLVEQRLLSTDIDPATKQTTIEPAHEALLRQWRLLQNWLAEDYGALTLLENLQRASQDWSDNQHNSDWLIHTAGRLKEAERLKERSDLSRFFKRNDRHYLTACRDLANETLAKERAAAERVRELEQKQGANFENQQELVQAEKMSSLGTLTAGVAHEVNNPNNFVHVSTQNLEIELQHFETFLFDLISDDADVDILNAFKQRFEPLYVNLDTIKDGTERIKTIVSDLRNFTQLDSPDRTTIQVADILQSTINLISGKFAKVATIVTDFQDNPDLQCYPAQLNQVFMNLIVNAYEAINNRQHEAPNPGEIQVGCKMAQNQVDIWVKDNGCGMSDMTKNKLFEPFYTTKEVGEGTGLGLSIAYGIVQKHNGELSVESTLMVGSTFTLKLPLDGINN
ncbi:MAG: GHKL domain-containing protein, partial [Algicola sp.]|nr:GHKL domain-containing protein [Algicola sp.]